MATRPQKGRKDSALDAARGRGDSAADLRRHLAAAPAPYLSGAIENPEFQAEEVLLLLGNPAAPPSLLLRIGRDRRWMRAYEAKKALLRHPRTPLTLARSLLPHFYWKDLADAAEDPRLPPSVRRQAEQILENRLDEMTQGERISLARRASRGVISALRESADARVLQALLGNGRLLEHDAVRIASSAHAPREVLSGLADHPSWGARYAVRISLVRNPRTPVPAALRLIGGLPRQDLQRLARDAEVPRIVRVGADRRLESAAIAERRTRRG